MYVAECFRFSVFRIVPFLCRFCGFACCVDWCMGGAVCFVFVYVRLIFVALKRRILLQNNFFTETFGTTNTHKGICLFEYYLFSFRTHVTRKHFSEMLT